LGKTLVIGLFIKLIGPSFYILLFTLLFYLIPNTNVKLKPAFISGVVTALLCFILKAAFVFLQSFITKYNAIYGSLAFIPMLPTTLAQEPLVRTEKKLSMPNNMQRGA